MPSYKRRSFLSSLLGMAVISGLSTGKAEALASFEPVWEKRIVEYAEYNDSSRLSDDTLVVATKWTSDSDQSTPPHITAFDNKGNQKWTWRWPKEREDPLEYVQALAPTADGGLFFAGPTNTNSSERTLIGKLDTEQDTEWHFTLEQYTYEDGLFLSRSNPSHLIVVGYEVTPSTSQSDVFGINVDEQSVMWHHTLSEHDTLSILPYQQGGVLAGENPQGGGVVRFTSEGDIAWDLSIPKPELELSDITTSSAGDIVTIGHRINEPQTLEVVFLGSDGTVNVRQSLDIQPQSNPLDPQIVSYSDGGYVCSWSHSRHSEIFVGYLSEEGILEYRTYIDPWGGEFHPALHGVELIDETIALLGNANDEGSTSPPIWSVGLRQSTSSPTPTGTPTPTLTNPPSANSTQTPSPTLPPTTIRGSASPPTDQPLTETSSTTGPGFRLITALVSTIGTGIFLILQNSDEES